MAFSKVAPCVSLHFAKISLHFPKMQGGDRFDRDCIRRQRPLLEHPPSMMVRAKSVGMAAFFEEISGLGMLI